MNKLKDVDCLRTSCLECNLRKTGLALTNLENGSIYDINERLGIKPSISITSCKTFMKWYNARIKKFELWQKL